MSCELGHIYTGTDNPTNVLQSEVRAHRYVADCSFQSDKMFWNFGHLLGSPRGRVGVYSHFAGDGPGVLLAESDVLTNTYTGVYNFTLQSPLSWIKGTTYWLAYHCEWVAVNEQWRRYKESGYPSKSYYRADRDWALGFPDPINLHFGGFGSTSWEGCWLRGRQDGIITAMPHNYLIDV